MGKAHSLLHSQVCVFVLDQVLRAALSLKENDLDDHLAQIIQEKRIKEQKDPTWVTWFDLMMIGLFFMLLSFLTNLGPVKYIKFFFLCIIIISVFSL